MPIQKIVTVSCLHQYFDGAVCNVISIEPTPRCASLLQRFGLIYKPESPGVFTILRRQYEGSVNVPVPSLPLMFYIFITGSEFHNYTVAPSADKDIAIDTDGNIIDEKKSGKKNGITTLLFMNEASSDKMSIAKASVPDAASLHKGVLFGMIRLVPPQVFQSYTIQLEATACKWRYYIVANASAAGLKVIDNSDAGTAVTAFAEISKNTKADETLGNLQQAFPDANIFISESKLKIAAVQKPKKILQLVRVVSDKENVVLVKNLPLPTPAENGKKIIFIQNNNTYF